MATGIEQQIVDEEQKSEKESSKLDKRLVAILAVFGFTISDVTNVQVATSQAIELFLEARLKALLKGSINAAKFAQLSVGSPVFNFEASVQGFLRTRLGDGLTFFDRVGRHTTKLTADITSELFVGIQQNKTLEQVQKAIGKRIGVFERSIKNLSGDTVHKSYVTGFKDSLQVKANAGKLQATKTYTYTTQGDDRVRDTHAALQGRVFTEIELLTQGLPPELFEIGCRCFLSP